MKIPLDLDRIADHPETCARCNHLASALQTLIVQMRFAHSLATNHGNRDISASLVNKWAETLTLLIGEEQR